MSLTNKELTRLQSLNPKPLQRVTMGGNKLVFANLPKDLQSNIKSRLAEKDPVMAKSFNEHKFGIVIDDKEVSSDNIKDFEISKSGEHSKAGKEFLEKHKELKPKVEEVKEKVEVKELPKETSKIEPKVEPKKKSVKKK